MKRASVLSFGLVFAAVLAFGSGAALGAGLSVSPAEFAFSMPAGGEAQSETLTVSNIGSGVMDWVIEPNEAGESIPDWLTIEPMGGSIPEANTIDVTVTVDPNGLTIGTHIGAFRVSATGASDSEIVEVTLRILPGFTIRVPEDCATIQAAVDAVPYGGTVVLSPGTYYENIRTIGKTFTLTSVDPNDLSIGDATVLDGGRISSVLYMAGGNLTLRGLTIQNGYAESWGGGLHITNGTSVVIRDCIVRGNSAGEHGGGIYARDLASFQVANTHFYKNDAYYAGGLYTALYTAGSANITSCIFRENTARFGGGVYWYGTGSMKNCLFQSNHAEFYGGGLWLDWARIKISNCTFFGNTSERGGGIRSENPSNYIYTISNSILWGNTPDQFMNSNYGSTPDVSYCCIHGWTGGGIGNIATAPQFFDITASDPAAWDLRLLPSSPCIDTGTNSPPGGLTERDFDGHLRPWDGDGDGQARADMGAYEWCYGNGEAYLAVSPDYLPFASRVNGPPPAVQQAMIKNYGHQTLFWFIDTAALPTWLSVAPTSGSIAPQGSEPVTLSADASGLPAGNASYRLPVCAIGSLNSPQMVEVGLTVQPSVVRVPDDYPTIQHAIDGVFDGTTIIVADGTYDFSDAAFQYPGYGIYFNGKAVTVRSENGPENCILDGGGVIARAFVFDRGEGSDSVLEGFTIRGFEYVFEFCYNEMYPYSSYIFGDYPFGGAILCYDSSPTLRNCIIHDNRMMYKFDIYVEWAPPYPSTNSIPYPTDPYYFSGGISCVGNASPVVTGCRLYENTCTGIECSSEASVSVTDCIIYGHYNQGYWNDPDLPTSGIQCESASIENCLIYENGDYGILSSGPIEVENCTISGHDVGIRLNSSSADVKNSIVWGNRATDLDLSTTGPVTVAYSDIDPSKVTGDLGVLEWGEGNLNADPLFARAGYWDDPNETPEDPEDDVWITGDYHLQSAAGRWDAGVAQWVFDAATSPCIDAGDPADAGWMEELWPHGGRINLGAYGGTAQASWSLDNAGSPADLDHDGAVDLADWGQWADDWLAQRALMDSDLDRDGDVDLDDLAALGVWWLWEDPLDPACQAK